MDNPSNNLKNYISYEYDFNNSHFRYIAVAKTKEASEELQRRGYELFFSPDIHGINCWILCRVQ